jgi:hypothetical protein
MAVHNEFMPLKMMQGAADRFLYLPRLFCTHLYFLSLLENVFGPKMEKFLTDMDCSYALPAQ